MDTCGVGWNTTEVGLDTLRVNLDTLGVGQDTCGVDLDTPVFAFYVIHCSPGPRHVSLGYLKHFS